MRSVVFGTILAIALVLFTGQFLVHFVKISQCGYPTSSISSGSSSPSSQLQILLVSDEHLLGKRRRIGIERIWNDWQAFITFRVAKWIHRPDFVVFMGDHFDEGGWPTPDADFSEYLRRFADVFQFRLNSKGSLYKSDSSSSQQQHVFVSGNHDISFGRFTQRHELNRYELAFGPSNHLQMVLNNRVSLIVLNTMALDRDVAPRSIAKQQAEIFLQDLVQQPQFRDSFKIFLTHLPLFRENDLQCGPRRLANPQAGVTFESPDFAYEECHHVLSKQLSSRLLEQLDPQVVLSGHTHVFCEYHHSSGSVPEYTMSSFSWGMRPDPSFALARIVENQPQKSSANESFAFQIQECALPHEYYVLAFYAGFVVVWSLLMICRAIRTGRSNIHRLPTRLSKSDKKST